MFINWEGAWDLVGVLKIFYLLIWVGLHGLYTNTCTYVDI